MRGSILDAEDLRAILGYEPWGEVARALRQQGVHVFTGKGGRPWTTIELINQSGGLRPAGEDSIRLLKAANV